MMKLMHILCCLSYLKKCERTRNVPELKLGHDVAATGHEENRDAGAEMGGFEYMVRSERSGRGRNRNREYQYLDGGKAREEGRAPH